MGDSDEKVAKKSPPVLGSTRLVRPLTYLAEVFVGERALAELALGCVAALVDSQVLRQVGLLGETLVAAGLLAYEGALPCMDPEMVEKVMPLAEEHAAVLEVALQNLHLAHHHQEQP